VCKYTIDFRLKRQLRTEKKKYGRIHLRKCNVKTKFPLKNSENGEILEPE